MTSLKKPFINQAFGLFVGVLFLKFWFYFLGFLACVSVSTIH